MSATKQITNKLQRLEINGNTVSAPTTPCTKRESLRGERNKNNSLPEEVRFTPNATPHVARSFPTEMRRRRKHYEKRVLPYNKAFSSKARKSLTF